MTSLYEIPPSRTIPFLTPLGRSLIALFLPRYCRLCNARMEEVPLATICPECWSRAEWIDDLFCRHCGLPLEYGGESASLGSRPLCGNCRLNPPRFDGARSLGVYTGVLREAVHDLKHRRRVSLARPLGRMMGRFLCESATEIPLARIARVIPVPLGPRKRRAREFNQSELLARGVAEAIDRPLDVTTLRRVKEGVDQQGLSRRDRFQNVKDAFAAEPMEGGVLIVDDVMTTGATLEAVTTALKKAGGRGRVGPVYCLTLARTPEAKDKDPLD